MTSPDAYANRSLGDLYPSEIIALSDIWPAAHDACVEVLLLIDNGQLTPETSDLELPLTTLVQEHAIHSDT